MIRRWGRRGKVRRGFKWGCRIDGRSGEKGEFNVGYWITRLNLKCTTGIVVE